MPDHQKLQSELELLEHLKNFYAEYTSMRAQMSTQEVEHVLPKMRYLEEFIAKQERFVAELSEKCAKGKEVQKELREEIVALEAARKQVEDWVRG